MGAKGRVFGAECDCLQSRLVRDVALWVQFGGGCGSSGLERCHAPPTADRQKRQGSGRAFVKHPASSSLTGTALSHVPLMLMLMLVTSQQRLTMWRVRGMGGPRCTSEGGLGLALPLPVRGPWRGGRYSSTRPAEGPQSVFMQTMAVRIMKATTIRRDRRMMLVMRSVMLGPRALALLPWALPPMSLAPPSPGSRR